jgi:hypothetical protein
MIMLLTHIVVVIQRLLWVLIIHHHDKRRARERQHFQLFLYTHKMKAPLEKYQTNKKGRDFSGVMVQSEHPEIFLA